VYAQGKGGCGGVGTGRRYATPPLPTMLLLGNRDTYWRRAAAVDLSGCMGETAAALRQ
jgi:hypothetical protein